MKRKQNKHGNQSRANIVVSSQWELGFQLAIAIEKTWLALDTCDEVAKTCNGQKGGQNGINTFT